MDSLIDSRYPIEGFFIRRPEFIKVYRRVEKIAAELLEEDGYQPVLFPTLIPEGVISKEVRHIRGFRPAVYWVTEIGRGKKLKERLALAISSETIFCLAFKNWLADGQSLPFKFYQQRTVFRGEHKKISPLLREKEFLWIEAHTAFRSEKECLNQTERDRRIINKLLEKFDLQANFVKRADDDRCPGAEITYGFDLSMPDGSKNQIASTHFLGQKFSRAFGVKRDDDRNSFIFQTSFGIGFSRIIAALMAYGKI
ncbi:hypothetical protein A2701_04880 [Candidatus Amesbacteria bacterium RIFCSPHIGHO2_01_FULL_47_34]|uniref:Proline--tRNA ligase n=3 Tax=Candidatus Amesiibacteriota TaxID=1752730 RepID=A0A0G1S111_9BACT|nr:MAG: Proline-tRNA ligase [Candidatus Amesbacteria bacterium GW2011_GWC1_47_15]KKU97602.1 MAG: Proline-tRNA ligase [Candidatus Amesbacteria bacterium GW2011_GWB1_48_13]OGD00391.1 MAG: hypothetical protein A2972_03945 [Candidatus Amesbacteria bacterium RIFCSPLOWO2_01_FULL_47_33]OGD00927.1 MAG: hypothetical protein A2701_04880 [Candidatus Amesbacteria bacterium RIFCSPHIGHO2_01_FULL_47_34]